MQLSIKDFKVEDLREALKEGGGPQSTNFFNELERMFKLLRGYLIKKQKGYQALLTDDIRIKVVFLVWRQLESMNKKKGIGHILNVQAYCKTLLKGYLSTEVKRELNRKRKLPTFSLDEFGIDNSIIAKDGFEDMDDLIDGTRDKEYIDRGRTFKVMVGRQTALLTVGEIILELQTDETKGPSLWHTYLFLYHYEISIEEFSLISGVSTRTADSRVAQVKEVLLNLARHKIKDKINGTAKKSKQRSWTWLLG